MGYENDFLAQSGDAIGFRDNFPNALCEALAGMAAVVGPVEANGVDREFEDFTELPPIVTSKRRQEFRAVVLHNACKTIADGVVVGHFEVVGTESRADQHPFSEARAGPTELPPHKLIFVT